MAKKYHSLLIIEAGRWTSPFGDFDKECVEFERDTYVEDGCKKKNIKLYTWAKVPTQAQLEDMLHALNVKEGR